jgi:hypothetical protein
MVIWIDLYSADVTSVINEKGYWPSYNIPYFPDIFNISGFQAYVKLYGNWFTYNKSPRALIFARDQGNVPYHSNVLHSLSYFRSILWMV